MKLSAKKAAALAMVVIAAAGAGLFGLFKSNSDILNRDGRANNRVEFAQVNENGMVLKSKSGGSTIKSDETFTITADNISEEYVNKYVSFGSGIQFTAKRLNETSVEIAPVKPLAATALVTLNLSDDNGNVVKKWAFQTQDTFKIVSTMPSDGDSWVSTDSGIEVRFSEADVDLESFKNAFSITPQCSGTFKQVGKTVAFIPDEELELNREYTVKIDGTVSDASGKTLGTAVKITFNTAKNYETDCFYDSNYVLDSFKQDDAQVAKLRVNSRLRGQTVHAEVYKFADFEHFYTQLTASLNSGYELDFSKLQQFSQFDAQQSSRNDQYDYDDASYVPFPENLPNGWYAVKYSISADDGDVGELVRFVQISPIAFYIAATSDKAMVWVNDTNRNMPASGANVSLLQNDVQYTAVTQNNGAAVISFPKSGSELSYDYNTYKKVVRIDCNGEKAAAVANTSGRNFTEAQSQYYSYIYTNREIYRTTDCIKVWGVIKPRNAAAKIPEKATVSFENYIGTFYECTVDVDENGTFTTEFNYEDLDCYYCEINLKVNGQQLKYDYVTIQDFTKPTYLINAKTDKTVYFAADNGKANVSIDVTFFDGTPASNLPLKLKTYNEGISCPESVTLDENGHTEISVQADMQKNSEWGTNYFSIWLESNANDTDLTDSGIDIRMYTRDIVMLTDVQYPEIGKPEVTLRLNKLNENAANITDNSYIEPKSIAGEAYDTEVTTDVYLNYYEKIETGEYYDFIYKKNVKTYDYQYRTKFVKSLKAKTTDGVLVIDDLPQLEHGQSYNLVFSCKDTFGRETTGQIFAYRGIGSPNYSEDAHRMNFSSGDNGYITGFRDGENIEVTLQNQYEDFAMPEGSYFITALVQDDFYDINLFDSKQFTIDFKEKNIPNARLVGAYYENGQVYTISQAYLDFIPESRELNIEITADKEQYKPGDTANVRIKVTDALGNPVRNVAVCASISDEAVFAVAPQYAEFIEKLFSAVNWDYIQSVSSNTKDLQDANGEGGGGDGGELRENFADDIFFGRLVTDSDGVAEFGAQLPDNLTSWRITAIAITDDLHGGDAKALISTKIPMFTTVAFTDTFLTGDSISFGVRTYGSSISGDETVKYTAIIKDKNGAAIKTKQQSLSAKKDASFVFDALPAGKYTFEISAATGGLSDAQALSFEVKDTASLIKIRRTIDADKINEIQAEKYPLTLMLSSKEYMVYNRVLNTLLSTANIRDEERAAAQYAYKLSCEMTGEQYSENGVTKNLYTDDVYMLARLCAAAPEYINNSRAIGRFNDILNDVSSSGEQVSAAYLGLAALGQPVLNDIRYLLQTGGESWSEDDLLRLCAAAAIIGDYDFAQSYYEQNIADRLQTFTLPDGTEAKHYVISDTETENVEPTALAAMTAFVLNNGEADMLAEYLMYAKNDLTGENGGIFYPICELAVYLRGFVPKNGEEVLLSYNSDGARVSLGTAKRGTQYISFASAEQYENANIMILSGDPYIEAIYTGSVKDTANIAADTVKIQKDCGEAKIGKLTKVTLTISAKAEGHILVKDFVPAGFCYDAHAAEYNENYTVVHGDNKSVTFSIDYKNPGEEIVIEYYIHASVKGTFTAEETVACLLENNAISIGERKKLTVK